MKRVYLIIGLLMLVALAAMPSNAFAATSASAKQHHHPHYFLHPHSQKVSRYAPAAASNLVYHGGPVQGGTTQVYAIFWEPTGNVSFSYNSLITRYFNDVGGSGLYHNNTQYTAGGSIPSNAVLAGTWVDATPYPGSPLLDTDIQNEVSSAQAVNGWVSSTSTIFFVFTEAFQDLCFDATLTQCASNAFCAYHSYFGTNTIYAAMPYAASFSCATPGSPNADDADLTINVTSHEQMEAATDPLLNAWYDSTGQEIGDKCAWNFGTLNADGSNVNWNLHPYIVQQEWDNLVGGCVLTGP